VGITTGCVTAALSFLQDVKIVAADNRIRNIFSWYKNENDLRDGQSLKKMIFLAKPT